MHWGHVFVTVTKAHQHHLSGATIAKIARTMFNLTIADLLCLMPAQMIMVLIDRQIDADQP